MFIQYNNLDISFQLEQTRFRTLNIALEKLERMIPSHSHGEKSYEIHYNAAGRGHILVEERLFDIFPNSLYLTGPQVAHAQIPDPEDPMVDYCIYLQLSHTGRQADPDSSISWLFEQRTFWIGKDGQQLDTLMNQLFDELKEQKPGYTVIVETLLKQLIVRMVRNYGSPPQAGREYFRPAALEKAQAFMIEEAFLYEYPSLTLERLAERLGIGIRQTQRLMQEYYGKSFLSKRNEARMSAAAILLTHTGRPVSRIADALGYSSAEHFAAAFKKYFGIPAREYRKKFAVGLNMKKDPGLNPPAGLRSALICREGENKTWKK